MGISLALSVCEYREITGDEVIDSYRFHSFATIHLDDRRNLFADIEYAGDTIGKMVPKSEGWDLTDAYGRDLIYLTVQDLLKFEKERDVNNSTVNKAAWVFLRAMPPESPVILEWR